MFLTAIGLGHFVLLNVMATVHTHTHTLSLCVCVCVSFSL